MTSAQAPVALEEEGERKWDILKPKIIGDGTTTYLERVTLILTPWFSIMLHRIFRPDNQREFHDHPWTFFSLLLRGWYCENTPQGWRRCRWFNFKRAEGRHSIRWVSRTPVWSLVFTGPRRRKWGFWVPPECDCGCDNSTPSQHGAFCSKYGVLIPAAGRFKFIEWDKYEKLNKA